MALLDTMYVVGNLARLVLSLDVFNQPTTLNGDELLTSG